MGWMSIIPCSVSGPIPSPQAFSSFCGWPISNIVIRYWRWATTRYTISGHVWNRRCYTIASFDNLLCILPDTVHKNVDSGLQHGWRWLQRLTWAFISQLLGFLGLCLLFFQNNTQNPGNTNDAFINVLSYVIYFKFSGISCYAEFIRKGLSWHLTKTETFLSIWFLDSCIVCNHLYTGIH